MKEKGYKKPIDNERYFLPFKKLLKKQLIDKKNIILPSDLLEKGYTRSESQDLNKRMNKLWDLGYIGINRRRNFNIYYISEQALTKRFAEIVNEEFHLKQALDSDTLRVYLMFYIKKMFKPKEATIRGFFLMILLKSFVLVSMEQKFIRTRGKKIKMPKSDNQFRNIHEMVYRLWAIKGVSEYIEG